jgi:hypothetical protein
MRVWNIRKNLKQHEWRSVLHRLDKLVARHQRKIRVRFLGEVVSEEKIKRSRDRYCVQSYSSTTTESRIEVTSSLTYK